MRTLLETRNSEGWNRAVEFAKMRYKKSYGANINPSPDYYLIVQGTDEKIKSCAGIWLGNQGKLFSEYYLEQSFHKLISKLEKNKVSRLDIAEIGSVASIHPIAGRTLFEMLSIITWCMGVKYLICTSNPRSIEVMNKCNVKFIPVCKAKISLAPKDEKIDWGSYYQSDPTTGYINLQNMKDHYHSIVLKTIFDVA